LTGDPVQGTWERNEKLGHNQAAPHVTGAVALLLAQNPALTADDVKPALHTAREPISLRVQRPTIFGASENWRSILRVSTHRGCGLWWDLEMTLGAWDKVIEPESAEIVRTPKRVQQPNACKSSRSPRAEPRS